LVDDNVHKLHVASQAKQVVKSEPSLVKFAAQSQAPPEGAAKKFKESSQDPHYSVASHAVQAVWSSQYKQGESHATQEVPE
jgi:hypothetical protein